ncbi:hypothetical protein MBLNU459_g8208t1 [Dothideomycetes sp. NU459]
MPQQTPDLRLDLLDDKKLEDVARRTSSPMDLHGIDITALDARDIHLSTASLTPLPASPDERERDQTKSFFGNHAPSPSTTRVKEDNPVSRQEPAGESRAKSISSWMYSHRKASGSTQVLSARRKDSDSHSDGIPASNAGSADANRSTSTVNTLNSATAANKSKANKKRLPGVLTRTKSLRNEDQLKSSAKSPLPTQSTTASQSSATPAIDVPVRTNGEKDRGLKDMMKTSQRERSAERPAAESEDDKQSKSKVKKEKKDEKDKQTNQLSSSYRGNNSTTFFTDFRHSSSKAANGVGKAGKGFFSKLTRSGSSNERSALVPEEDHVVRILNLPLIDQTRITRIAKSYDHCRDKTEFWMPALPWRCIDFLNGKCEEEGLYRISGGLTKIKEWRKRFDLELDVNLLDEPELYDASIIASLFKEWIRELPEEIFPKDAQARVISQLPYELPDRGSVPDILRNELQHLPPFNYYLLFAITCHLSLLLSYEPKNKMTLDNLYRCFNQSLKLDGRIFYTLVGDWRQCWAGCLTENDFLKAEYDYLQHPYPQSIGGQEEISYTGHSDERALSSSGSSAPPATGIFTPEMQRPATAHTQPSNSNDEGDERMLSPERKVQRKKRSSSDVTGMSPMRISAAQRG